MLTTDKFEGLSRRSAAQAGLPDARIVAVPHPIGGLRGSEIDRLGDAAVEDTLAALLGSVR